MLYIGQGIEKPFKLPFLFFYRKRNTCNHLELGLCLRKSPSALSELHF